MTFLSKTTHTIFNTYHNIKHYFFRATFLLLIICIAISIGLSYLLTQYNEQNDLLHSNIVNNWISILGNTISALTILWLSSVAIESVKVTPPMDNSNYYSFAFDKSSAKIVPEKN